MQDRNNLWNLGDLGSVKNTLQNIAKRLGERPVVHLWNPRQRISFDLPGGVWMIDHGTTTYQIRCRACQQQPALRYEFLVESDDEQLYGPIGSTCLFVHTLGAEEAFKVGQNIIKAFQDAEKLHLEFHRRIMRASTNPEEYLATFGLRWAAEFVREETLGMSERLVQAVWNVLGPRLPLPRHSYHALLALQRQLNIWEVRPTVYVPTRSIIEQGSVAHSKHTVLRTSTFSEQEKTKRQINTGVLERLRRDARAQLKEETAVARLPQTRQRRVSNYNSVNRPMEPAVKASTFQNSRKDNTQRRQENQPTSQNPSKRHKQSGRGGIQKTLSHLQYSSRSQQAIEAFPQSILGLTPVQLKPEERLAVLTLDFSVDPWDFYLASTGLPKQCPGLDKHPDRLFKTRIERHYQKKRKLDSTDTQQLQHYLKNVEK